MSDSGNKNKKQNGETPFYDFIPLNHDPRHQHSIKSAAAAIADSTALPLAKTGSPHDKGIIKIEKNLLHVAVAATAVSFLPSSSSSSSFASWRAKCKRP